MLQSQSSLRSDIAVKLRTWTSFVGQQSLVQVLRHIPGNTFDDVDVLWFIFSTLALAVQAAAVGPIMFPSLDIWTAEVWETFMFVFIYMCLHHVMLLCVAVVCRYAPYKCLGSIWKMVIELVTLSSSMLLRVVLEHNLLYLLMLMGFTADVHIFARFMHIAYDVDVWDIVWGLLMQLLVYTTAWNACISAVVSVSCFGLILYRFWHYSSPDIPLDAKDLENLAC